MTLSLTLATGSASLEVTCKASGKTRSCPLLCYGGIVAMTVVLYQRARNEDGLEEGEEDPFHFYTTSWGQRFIS